MLENEELAFKMLGKKELLYLYRSRIEAVVPEQAKPEM